MNLTPVVVVGTSCSGKIRPIGKPQSTARQEPGLDPTPVARKRTSVHVFVSSLLGRVVMLNHLSEWLRLADGTRYAIGGRERAILDLPGSQYLEEFRLENGLPVWKYDFHGTAIEKQVLMPHQQNTVHVTYRMASGAGPIRLKLRPAVHFRSLEGSVHASLGEPYTITAVDDRPTFSAPGAYPPLRLKIFGVRATFALDGATITYVHYRTEAERGYADIGDLWSPGYFCVDLDAETPATLMASTENWDAISRRQPGQRNVGSVSPKLGTGRISLGPRRLAAEQLTAPVCASEKSLSRRYLQFASAALDEVGTL